MSNYDASNIQVLEGLEAVRKRPGMYIGSTGLKGLHHLVWEILDNSIDEAMAGFADKVIVTIKKDGSVQVEDDGRGIPVAKHPKTGLSTVETVLTVLHAGGKFDSETYKVSGGLHGVGASVVNALSEKLEVWVQREGKIHYLKFTNGGKPENELSIVGESDKTGTKIVFSPDFSIMEKNEFDFNVIANRLRQTAYLNKGINLVLEDERIGLKKEYCFEGGIVEYVNELNLSKERIGEEVIYAESKQPGNDGEILVEVAMQYNTSYQNNVVSYANNISTIEGGTHEQGFLDSLTRIFNAYAGKKGLFNNDKEKLSREDVKEGLTAIISIKHPDPIYEGQTKGKLGNIDARKAVNKTLSIKLERYMEENPAEAKMIVEKTLLSQRARFAAQKAREATRKSSAYDIAALPGKLADNSSKNAEISELYIVEGDSAGGSAKSGRDRETQAILPLRGKVINVEKANIKKVFENAEIGSLITALGTGIGEEFNINKLRYHKIIIMTDADVDGAHIRTLLLTFFYRYFRPLIEFGFVYVAQPPLYKITSGKTSAYKFTDSEKEEYISQLGQNKKYSIQRYKGLGEMDYEELWETTMNPYTRKMLQIQIEDAAIADITFSMLMGDDVSVRKEFINENAKYVKNIDL
ncbi:MAG: DNA topoisomerase (ATP-hydrolyzing) subunit B [Mycoplasma sp.]|nr:DNA topoisomerase (ATP-hydrolyzing) subunit B [Mycoplasma sp.]